VRYLTRQFAIGALRRGAGVEQFLGGAHVAGAAAVSWVAVSPSGQGYRVSLHVVEDLDGRHADLAEFPSLDPVDEEYAGQGRELGRSEDELAALQLAEQLAGARPGRWVNFAMAGDEYLDYVRAGREAAE
jgi:hypothetical protein